MTTSDMAPLPIVLCVTAIVGAPGAAAAQATDPMEIELVRAPSAQDYYPPQSEALGETGRAVVQCTLSASGVPQDCRVVESAGYPRLDAASIALVEAQTYRARSGGSIAGVAILRPIRWALRK